MSYLPRIGVTRKIFPEGLDRLKSMGTLIYNEADNPMDAQGLIQFAKGGDVLVVTTQCPMTADVFASLPDLKMVANIGVGYNNIDIGAAQAHQVTVSNTPDVLTQATADMAWALMMSAARRVSESEQWLRSGQWNRWAMDLWLGADVYGRTLGILGMGRIGQAIAKRASGFDMNVIYHNRRPVNDFLHGSWVSKDELLERSDHLIVVVPYSTETHHIIGEAELKQMKSSAVLVNIGRGGLVDDCALADALKNKRIAAAGLDVFEGEPTIHSGLLEVSNIVLTPHIGSATYQSRLGMMMLAIDNVNDYLNFKTPRNRVI